MNSCTSKLWQKWAQAWIKEDKLTKKTPQKTHTKLEKEEEREGGEEEGMLVKQDEKSQTDEGFLHRKWLSRKSERTPRS